MCNKYGMQSISAHAECVNGDLCREIAMLSHNRPYGPELADIFNLFSHRHTTESIQCKFGQLS